MECSLVDKTAGSLHFNPIDLAYQQHGAASRDTHVHKSSQSRSVLPSWRFPRHKSHAFILACLSNSLSPPFVSTWNAIFRQPSRSFCARFDDGFVPCNHLDPPRAIVIHLRMQMDTCYDTLVLEDWHCVSSSVFLYLHSSCVFPFFFLFFFFFF